ncbi:condensation domain-containing protein [Micromonospora sp. R77]|uniref:condensation domain-containing protein n=1 Tax=Micromonospora sp. R77 TaxID=2925836 RepID=UPI001F604766|nr:condensation domain-containing protein [Micromonospora sp. R77]MCI4061237.1 condensation domain-containing protein [Micromonospora sp. R77]
MDTAPTVTTDGPLLSGIPLSYNQEFLCGFDRGDEEGPFGPHNHIVHGWRLRGRVDGPTLRLALGDLVVRHETLRTRIIRHGPQQTQEVFPAVLPDLAVRDEPGLTADARERRVEELLNEVEAGELPVGRLPLLRALLVTFDADDALLILVVHHTATDGWSVRVLARDLAGRYAARRGHPGHELPPASPYREYAQWQRSLPAESAGPARDYWRAELRDARIFAVPADRPKSAGLPESTAVHRFLIGAELVAPALQVARASRSTPFMVLLAAFTLLANRMTGDTDVVVPTFSPGRADERFTYTVGPFFNLLPLRTRLADCRTFLDVVARVRRSCLDGYGHDLPFPQIAAEAPELMLPVLRDDAAACVFQVFPFPFVLDDERVGDLVWTEMRRRLVSQPVGSDVPNGALWTLNLDPVGDIVGSVQYNSNLYDERTVAAMVRGYREVLAEVVPAADAPLRLA